MKFKYQPGGEKGIITWSLILVCFLLGIILQLEIFKLNIIAPIVCIATIVFALYLIGKSQILLKKDSLIIKSPFKKSNRKIDFSELSKVEFGKYYFVLYFKSLQYFPIRIIASPKIISKLPAKIKI